MYPRPQLHLVRVIYFSLLVQAVVFDMAYELIDYFTEVSVLNRAFLQTGTERNQCSLGFLPLTDLCYTQQYIFTSLVHQVSPDHQRPLPSLAAARECCDQLGIDTR